MSLSYVLPLNDAEAVLETVGGKGASLAQLVRGGLPVPGGFHVTTAAYKECVQANDLQPCLRQALADVDLQRPETLEAASRKIATLFEEATVPADIVSAITRAYGDLPGDRPPVAVRSSATAEDLPGLSFAGQQETYLNVRGPEDVLDAVKRCWASLWTARAIGYRAKNNVDQDSVSLAVVVQLLVPAEAAGILFTADPVNGQRDRVMISASWGLGEAVVGGLVTPDTVAVDKVSSRVLSRQTADKEVMTVRLESGGTKTQPAPEALRRAPVLDDMAAGELTRLGVRIEQLFHGPTDIEWTLTDGAFAIVQARPITALPEPELPPPTEWPVPMPKGGLYTRGSVADFLPDPLSPLFKTVGVPAIDAALSTLLEQEFGVKGMLNEGMLMTVNDYAYMGIGLTTWKWVVLLGRMIPAFPRLLRTAEHRWHDVALPRYAEATSRWSQRPPAELKCEELLAGVEEIAAGMAYYLTTLESGTMGAAGGSEGLFTAVYDRMIKREGDPAAPTFLLGYDSIPIQGEKALYDLTQWCRSRPGLTSYLTNTSTAQLVQDLDEAEAPQGCTGADWPEWQGRLRQYLDKYGYSIYDLDFSKPLPMEDPTPIFKVIKMYLAGQGSDPHERQRRFTERREAAAQTVTSRLRGLKLRIFRKVLGWAQWLAPLREDGIADLGVGYPQVRRMLLELGRRLAEAGAIEVAGDVFWLLRDEVAKASDVLDRGEAPPSFLEDVRIRRASWRAAKRVSPPPQLPPSKKWMGINMAAFLPQDAESQVGEVLKGLGASPGRATGVARVLGGPADFDQMHPQDVLVASITTPAWTPLFAMASAIVTDVGGPLSHGSIVAREYGIPAVLGTGVATRRIQSGRTITVDGSAGLVHLGEALR